MFYSTATLIIPPGNCNRTHSYGR